MYILKLLRSFSLPLFNRNTDNKVGAKQWPSSLKKKFQTSWMFCFFFQWNALSNRWSINVNHKSARLTKFTLLDQYTEFTDNMSTYWMKYGISFQVNLSLGNLTLPSKKHATRWLLSQLSLSTTVNKTITVNIVTNQDQFLSRHKVYKTSVVGSLK